MKRLILAGLLLLLSACVPAQATPAPTQSPDAPVHSISSPEPGPPADFAPQPGDASLQREIAFLDSAAIQTLESFPPQFVLSLEGSLPTPCHSLRIVIGRPDAQNRIDLELYSVMDPKMLCAEVIQPFSKEIPLGSFPAGHYKIFINGEQKAEFDA